MLGLGVGIDYALFVLSRHRRTSRGRHAGARRPSATPTRRSGLSVLFASGTVILAIVGVRVSRHPDARHDGLGRCDHGGGHDAGVADAPLPAVLGILRTRVNSLRIPFLRQRQDGGGLTSRWARTVARSPRRAPSAPSSSWSP